jgi:adiponectin receptor
MMVIALSAATTMGLSAVFHLMFVVGRPQNSVLQRLDYAGIVILIAGSTFASVYFFFYCRPVAFWTYVLAATATNTYVGVMAQTEVFGSTKYDLLRPAAFTAAGVLCAVPILHSLMLPELAHVPAYWAMLQAILLQGGLYLVGVSLYASKFPERLFPGWCDVFLGSHQLFHLCVAAAAWTLYSGAQHMEGFLEQHPRFCASLQ